MKVMYELKGYTFFIDTDGNIVSAFKTNPFTYVGSTEYVNVKNNVTAVHSILYLLNKPIDKVINDAISPKWLFSKYSRIFKKANEVHDDFFDQLSVHIEKRNAEVIKKILYEELNKDLIKKAKTIIFLYSQRNDVSLQEKQFALKAVSLADFVLSVMNRANF